MPDNGESTQATFQDLPPKDRLQSLNTAVNETNAAIEDGMEGLPKEELDQKFKDLFSLLRAREAVFIEQSGLDSETATMLADHVFNEGVRLGQLSAGKISHSDLRFSEPFDFNGLIK
jgi:hypothetical protein